MMGNNILIESMSWVPHIFEGADKLTRMRFKFMEAEKVNVNKRRYPADVLSHAVSEAQKKINSGGSIYGSLGHLGTFEVSDISHRILSLSMNGHDAVAEAQVLNTSKGRDLFAVIQAGGAVGVSARGTGNVVNEGGIDVVQSDYCLAGIDCVINPSFDAHISQANIYESASFDVVEPKTDPHTLMKLFSEARLAGYAGTLAHLEENINKIDQRDEGLMQEYREARLAGFTGSYSEFRELWLQHHDVDNGE
ncbi:MAG: hypothetical protein MUQ00_13350 [Candidatus Aminicenantes bacterium]|nr:hypothetical protein [Candidatus Aminicenantes bacterium]